jgi:hypothetical protein
MPFVDSAITSKFKQEAQELGRIALSTKYPNEFEVYMMSLELADSDGKTLDFFSFPVMPSQITKPDNKRVKTKTSASGVTQLMSDAFSPSEISIKGDFGRSFKILLKPNLGEVEGYAFKGFWKDLKITTPKFSAGIKTGFGCIKELQSFLDRANTLDSKGKPNRLYLYNMALNESYLVAPTPQGFIMTQSYDKNMIWTYSLTLTILAPLDKIQTIDKANSSKKLLESNMVQNFANRLASEIKNFL